MPQVNATHLVAGFQKKDPRLYEVLRMFAAEIQSLRNALGRGLNSTVSPPNLTVSNRRTFAEVANGSVGNQSNLKAGEQGNVVAEASTTGTVGTGYSLKRLSVRL